MQYLHVSTSTGVLLSVFSPSSFWVPMEILYVVHSTRSDMLKEVSVVVMFVSFPLFE